MRAEVNQVPFLPTGRYRVLYADPPWLYNDKLMIKRYVTIGADYHYPCLSIQKLCELSVHDLGEANSVLFLWVTSPMLEGGFAVIKAWGYKYKASFVWDKVRHTYGHYNSVRHELLLVCTRGSCLPDSKKLVDSVLTIERTSHSAKPPEFRQLIDKLYPHGARIELFARERAVGWDVWGNDIKCE